MKIDMKASVNYSFRKYPSMIKTGYTSLLCNSFSLTFVSLLYLRRY